jgi:hypothetical protein
MSQNPYINREKAGVGAKISMAGSPRSILQNTAEKMFFN